MKLKTRLGNLHHKYILIACIWLCFTSANGQESNSISLEQLQSEMLAKTADIVSVSCDFEQHKHLQYLDAVVTSTGKLIFDKKNRLRWEYVDPFEYLIVINNGTFSIKTDGRVSEYDIESNKMFSQISELIVSSVNGTIFTDPSFNVSAEQNEKEYTVLMQPKDEEIKKVLSKIKLQIDRTNFSVNKVIMYEKEDNYTEINFLNKKFNAELAADTFACE